jgi:hypothetical protein
LHLPLTAPPAATCTLLPQELQLHAPSCDPAAGVVFRYRRAGDGGGGGWSESLGALSGGQRTLVALALLLAAARAGAHSSVFLMDEVGRRRCCRAAGPPRCRASHWWCWRRCWRCPRGAGSTCTPAGVRPPVPGPQG